MYFQSFLYLVEEEFSIFAEFTTNRFAIVLVFCIYLNFVANTLDLVKSNPSFLAVRKKLKRKKHCRQKDLTRKK